MYYLPIDSWVTMWSPTEQSVQGRFKQKSICKHVQKPCHRTLVCKLFIHCITTVVTAHIAGAVEYANCISEEE